MHEVLRKHRIEHEMKHLQQLYVKERKNFEIYPNIARRCKEEIEKKIRLIDKLLEEDEKSLEIVKYVKPLPWWKKILLWFRTPKARAL